MLIIQVGDKVIVSLPGQGTGLNNYEVKSIPGNNQVYWELESPAGDITIVGPSLITMVKMS